MKTLSLIFTLLFSLPLIAAESRIIAVVNQDIITERDLNNRLKLALISAGLKDTKSNREDLKEQILQSLIEEALQLQVIETEEIEVTQDDIDDTIAHMEKASNSPAGSTRKLLRANHIPQAVLDNQAKAYLGWRQRMETHYVPSITVPDHEVDRELKKLQGEQEQVQYHLAEIFLPIDDQISDVKARKDINKLRANIERGASFQAIAQQFSHSATAAKGGDMGWLGEDQLSPEYKEAIETLQPGQLSKPIKSARGYSIVLYLAKQVPGQPIDTEVSILQAVLPYPQMANDYEVDQTLQQLTDMGKKANSCSALRKAVTADGGVVQGSGTVSMQQLNAEIKRVIKGLAPGQATRAMMAEEGGILFMLCSKNVIEPHEWTKEQVKGVIIDRKLKLFSRRDMRDLKRNAFIEIRS